MTNGFHIDTLISHLLQTYQVEIMLPGDDVSQEFLQNELLTTGKALAEAERREQQLLLEGETTSRSEYDSPHDIVLAKLSVVGKTTHSLKLAQDVAEWMESVPGEPLDIFQEAQMCIDLAILMMRHKNILELCAPLYEDKYLPLHQYVHSCLIASLRQELEGARYPSEKACLKLIRDCKGEEPGTKFPEICRCLARLQTSHRQVIEMAEGTEGPGERQSDLFLELFRPLVERIKFHFVSTDKDRITTTRIDRLPEWLMTYVRENILEGGPWDLVNSGLSIFDENLPFEFLNELVTLIFGVLNERNFFRNSKIAGPRSNPLLLCNALEQLLQFDKTLRECLTPPVGKMLGMLGLVDTLVARDEELLRWWIERERENALSTLFDDTTMLERLISNVSPRAEIFCALIRSIQHKAAVLSFPGPYLRDVAVPLCTHFVDAIHETSVELKNLMVARRGLPSNKDLVASLSEWIELINGTRLARSVLMREGAWTDGKAATRQSDHDLARFGRSLERLEGVLVEEFAATFVETILMERAKLASYLMMASHLLASEEWDADETDLSAELRETNVVLAQFHVVCDAAADTGSVGGEIGENQGVARFAPSTMREIVMNRLADKFLEVALDIHNVTPDIWRQGALVFARDVEILMRDTSLPSVQRLLDIVKFLSMESKTLEILFSALGGLVGTSTFLNIYDFSNDGTIYEEATSMIKAKGLTWIKLEDIVSILNRRRDLVPIENEKEV
jgi:hypothetical protein